MVWLSETKMKRMKMTRIRIIKEADEDEPLIAIVLLDESEIHPASGTVYPVMYVGYGDDVMMMCTDAWVDEQETLEELDYDGETDFASLYENIMLKRV